MEALNIKSRNTIGYTLLYLLLLIGALIALMPLIWMVLTSLKAGIGETYSLNIFPKRPQWRNYLRVFELTTIERGFLNSSIISALTIIGSLLTSSITGFAFARIDFPGRNFLFAVLLLTMLVPPAVMIIPQYLMFNRFGWIDSFLPLWVPWFFGGGAFNIFLFRQFFRSIPAELDQAAEIDGCSTFGIYWRIIMPLSKPAIATVVIFTFMGAWNDFFSPLIYLNSQEKDTIVLTVLRLTSEFEFYLTKELHTIMAANVLIVVPSFVVFFFAQKYFIQGIVTTGFKG